MRDLRADLATLWSVATRLRPAQGARSIMFVAARSGEGTSSMAASFALMAAEHVTRTAWLVDLDLMHNAAHQLLTACPVTGTRLLVTRFRTERLAAGQRAHLRSEPGWWKALRRSTDWIVVDSPALDRSDVALDVASEVDGVVLVVQAEVTRAEEVAEAQFAIESRGGRVIGVVLNRMRADARLAGRIAS